MSLGNEGLIEHLTYPLRLGEGPGNTAVLSVASWRRRNEVFLCLIKWLEEDQICSFEFEWG